MNQDTRAADFLQEVQCLVCEGWYCFVDLNKPKNRDYCDQIGMPYKMASIEVRDVLLDLDLGDKYSGPNPDINRKSTDHFYEFKGIHHRNRVFLRFKIDRDKQRIYINSFHEDQKQIF